MKASVVVASIVGTPFIDDCLTSISRQASQTGAEVIVVTCGEEEKAARIGRAFPWVRVVHRPGRETVPSLRRIGVEAATGDIAAIIEEHCVAGEEWLTSAITAIEGGKCGVAGGPIVDNGYNRLRDWVVYFLEYNGYLPPAPNGEVRELNGANIAYCRRLLIDHLALLSDGYWETNLHPTLLREGTRFLSVPQMVVHHRGPFDYGYYLRQRYWFSRAFAGARASTLGATKRATYLVAAPAIPALLFARMASRVWRKRCRVPQFAMSAPLLVPALAALVAGEWVGYLRGPGDALSKVE